ncbi:MAG: patatin family protein [Eubacteriales bacterium]|nr:patatin family protein [Clostridiales bacterium]MDY5835811.1 patatin family protein [Eubacteriales bacterium]
MKETTSKDKANKKDTLKDSQTKPKVSKSPSPLDLGLEIMQKLPELAANLAEATKDSLSEAKDTLIDTKDALVEAKDKLMDSLSPAALDGVEIFDTLQASQAFCQSHTIKPCGSCLVIQGGSLRGVHSLGVLYALDQAGISFDCVMGVSAGSLNGLSFISGQLDRARRLMVDLIEDKAYIGNWESLVKDRSWINFDFMFDGAPDKLEPFDMDAFRASPTDFVCNATDLESGEPVRFSKCDCQDIQQAAIASATLPLASTPTKIGDKYYMDGGISEPILYTKAMEDGYQKIVVLLTRVAGFRKTEFTLSMQTAVRTVYRKYPRFAKTLLNQEVRYNAFVDQLEKLAADHPDRFFLIYPQAEVDVNMVNRSSELTQKYLDQGQKEAEAIIPDLKAFLSC